MNIQQFNLNNFQKVIDYNRFNLNMKESLYVYILNIYGIESANSLNW